MIQPLNEYIAIEPLPIPERLITLVQPRTFEKRDNNCREGIVRAVGPGDLTKRGDRVPCQVQVGDRVIYNPQACDVRHDGMDLVKVGWVWGVIETAEGAEAA